MTCCFMLMESAQVGMMIESRAILYVGTVVPTVPARTAKAEKCHEQLWPMMEWIDFPFLIIHHQE